MQVFENRRDEFFPRAALVQVFDPQQKFFARPRRHAGSKGVAQMQKAGW